MYTLTKRADQILKSAKEIARSYGFGYVGTEHLLLAIVREGEGLGARVLAEAGATNGKITEEVNRLLKDRLHETWVMGRLPGTPHFRDVLAKAAQEAKGRGNWQICSVHLLLAVLSEKDSTGCRALEALGVSAESVRRGIVQLASTS